jgi:hypothetical protein
MKHNGSELNSLQRNCLSGWVGLCLGVCVAFFFQSDIRAQLVVLVVMGLAAGIVYLDPGGVSNLKQTEEPLTQMELDLFRPPSLPLTQRAPLTPILPELTQVSLQTQADPALAMAQEALEAARGISLGQIRVRSGIGFKVVKDREESELQPDVVLPPADPLRAATAPLSRKGYHVRA